MWWHLIQNPKPIWNWVPSSLLSLHDPIFHVYWWGWKNNLHTILDVRDTRSYRHAHKGGVGGDALKALVSSVPFDLRLTPISQNSHSKKHLQVCKDVSFCRTDIAPCHCSYCVFGFINIDTAKFQSVSLLVLCFVFVNINPQSSEKGGIGIGTTSFFLSFFFWWSKKSLNWVTNDCSESLGTNTQTMKGGVEIGFWVGPTGD